MNELDQKLKQIKLTKQIGLMTHVVIGYPSLEKTVELVKIMAKYADIIELQIPFSDPLADGPTIMKACEQSIKNGTKVSDAFKIMKQLSQEVAVPLLLMGYYNTVFKYPSASLRTSSVEQFIKDAKEAGASGLIVPDMPIDEEENEHFYAYCKKYNLHAIHVVSPASTDERLQKNAALATGFVYATARQGITGVQGQRAKSTGIRGFLQRVRKNFAIPIAVGFGISSAEQIKRFQGKSDIAVIGSALIDVINTSKNMQKGVEDFLAGISMLE